MKLNTEQLNVEYPNGVPFTNLSRGRIEDQLGISLRKSCGDTLIVGVIRVDEKLHVCPNGSPEYDLLCRMKTAKPPVAN